MIPKEFTCVMMASLPRDQRNAKLRELESCLNGRLAGSTDLEQWQSRLYGLIEELSGRGFSLGRWDYDSEVETWGGPSYMDPSKEDNLLLRSVFPKGVTLAWKKYDDLERG
jgi:hypothetical protein